MQFPRQRGPPEVENNPGSPSGVEIRFQNATFPSAVAEGNLWTEIMMNTEPAFRIVHAVHRESTAP